MIPDDYSIHAALTEPRDSWFMSGSDICRGNYPEDYSILIKFLPDNAKYSLNLLNISNERSGLAITLDLCYNTINVTFGSDCGSKGIAFPLPSNFDVRRGNWHRIGASFSSDLLYVFVDCSSVNVFNISSGCRVRPCDEDANVHILQPTHSSHCGSEGEVSERNSLHLRGLRCLVVT